MWWSWSSPLVSFLSAPVLVNAEPLPLRLGTLPRPFDIQGHRGGRGHTVENTLPSFAWGLINGVSTLEMDNGITKDGHVVVWHDESIVPTKCRDTAPVSDDDPLFPYVGKFLANLTLAQVKTLDCGAIRQHNFPQQILYPSTRISTLTEVFSFLSCADPQAQIKLNIESKIDADYPNRTVSPDEFVQRQYEVFKGAGARYLEQPAAITYQSFDWRTLSRMKKVDSRIALSALVDADTATLNSTWLDGLALSSFAGPSFGEKVAQAAGSLGVHILSPDSSRGTEDFTTKEMVDEAHGLGILVKPWTVDDLEVVRKLVMDWSVDGIIADYPRDVRRWAKFEAKLPVSRRYPRHRVMECLAEHHRLVPT